jgi:hypothetical protein
MTVDYLLLLSATAFTVACLAIALLVGHFDDAS